jgi:hypothetical protein
LSPRPELVALSEELADHLARVRTVAGEIEAAEAPPPDADRLWAMAARLHSFYTGCESVLARAVRPFEGAPRSAPDSHVQLLRQAARDLPDVRPPVIRRETADALEPFLRFRHFFRNAYGVTLEWPRMERKVRGLRAAFDRFAADVEEFRRFLVAASRA